MSTAQPRSAMPAGSPGAVVFGPDGMVPVVVQDRLDGRVLMVAWMDAEALAATMATGDVHFHSRSRDRLWRKGETSGNLLRLVDIAADCDGDALLLTVQPVGPTCHRGTRSCFDPAGASAGRTEPAGASAGPPTQGFAWLETLWTTIDERATTRPDGSYTAGLMVGGVDAVARKLTEEATEVLIAAKDDAIAQSSGTDRSSTRDALAGEAADLLYHALVLLIERNVQASDVIDRLRARHHR